jgi:predicted nucleic acid-binding Zn ribbon protein
MVDAKAVKEKAAKMQSRRSRNTSTTHISAHKHCRICGINIDAKVEVRVCKNSECIARNTKDEKNQKLMRRWMFIFLGLFSIPVVLKVMGF